MYSGSPAAGSASGYGLASESGGRLDERAHHVLWLDDRPIEIGGLAQYLRLRGCDVDIVETDGAALSALRVGEPDFLILDWKLSNGTAEPVLEACRREHPGLPVLVLTGYATPDLEEACLRLGAVRFREKPIHGEDLLALVRRHPKPAWWPYRWTWTRRACHVLSAQHDLVDVARRFARSLEDDDISIPEVLTGSHLLGRLIAIPRDDLRDLSSELTSRIIDCRHLPPAVVSAIRVFETWAAPSPLPTEEDLARLVQPAVSRSRLSELISQSTHLHVPQWKLGARLRYSIRALVTGDSAMKMIAPESGWSSPEQFSRIFHEALGMSPSEFRAFATLPDRSR